MKIDKATGKDQETKAKVRVTVEELYSQFKHILDKEGFAAGKSDLCSRIFAENTRDGVHSHGINRFAGFVDYVQRAVIDKNAEPVLIDNFNAFERWDGQQGPGTLNAHFTMNRAIELARLHGIGCAVLRNNNHWMRAGTYGLQAAEAGCIGVCWTNTTVLMPPWGSMEAKLGNNPLTVCVPRKGGHLLLDTAMSQFSLGRLLIAAKSDEKLPVPGGFDEQGNMTDDPEKILRSKCPMPIGFWKGSGLSLLLDCVVSVLSAGQATHDIGQRNDETNVSQIFIAIDLEKTGSTQLGESITENIIDDLHSANPIMASKPVTFPGETMLKRRHDSDENGIMVDADIWRTVKEL